MRYEYQGNFDGDLHIRVLNGRSNTANCTWLIYLTNPGEEEVQASLWDSLKNNSQVTLRYSKTTQEPQYYVRIGYRIEYDPSCSSKPGPRPYSTDHFVSGGSAFQLMEKVVNDCKYQVSYCNCSVDNYAFYATYCPNGYKIDMIDNTQNDPKRHCYWKFYYIHHDWPNNPFSTEYSPSRFVFDTNDYTVLMRYEKTKKKQTCKSLKVRNSRHPGSLQHI